MVVFLGSPHSLRTKDFRESEPKGVPLEEICPLASPHELPRKLVARHLWCVIGFPGPTMGFWFSVLGIRVPVTSALFGKSNCFPC